MDLPVLLEDYNLLITFINILPHAVPCWFDSVCNWILPLFKFFCCWYGLMFRSVVSHGHVLLSFVFNNSKASNLRLATVYLYPRNDELQIQTAFLVLCHCSVSTYPIATSKTRRIVLEWAICRHKVASESWLLIRPLHNNYSVSYITLPTNRNKMSI